MHDDPDERGTEMKRWQFAALVEWHRNTQKMVNAQSFLVGLIFFVVVILPVLRHFGWIIPQWDYWR